MKVFKTNYKTSEFWFTLISSLIPFAGWITENIALQWAVGASAMIISTYNISRGLAKKGK